MDINIIYDLITIKIKYLLLMKNTIIFVNFYFCFKTPFEIIWYYSSIFALKFDLRN